MSLRIDSAGKVRTGKTPTTVYRVRWQNGITGTVITEEKTDSLGTLKNYIFSTIMSVDSRMASEIRAEIWRTYKSTSRCIYSRGGGLR